MISMICVTEKALREKARHMPISYLADCEAAATKQQDGTWCFAEDDFVALRKKYHRYTVSVADPYRSRISGCCDRADQY